MEIIQHGTATICILKDKSLARVEADGSGRFFGSDGWRKRRILVLKGKKPTYRWAAEWDFRFDSQEQAIEIMRGLEGPIP